MGHRRRDRLGTGRRFCASHGAGAHPERPAMDCAARLFSARPQPADACHRDPGPCAGIYGYGFQRLIEATGPVRATLILIAVVAGIHAGFTPTRMELPTAPAFWSHAGQPAVLSLLVSHPRSVAAVGTALRVGASTALLFGLADGAATLRFTSVVDTRAPARSGSPEALRPRRGGILDSLPACRHSHPGPRHRRLRLELHPSAHHSRRIRRHHCATGRPCRHGAGRADRPARQPRFAGPDSSRRAGNSGRTLLPTILPSNLPEPGTANCPLLFALWRSKERRSDNAVSRPAGYPAHAPPHLTNCRFPDARLLPGDAGSREFPCKTGKKWRKILSTRGASHGLSSWKTSSIAAGSALSLGALLAAGLAGAGSLARAQVFVVGEKSAMADVSTDFHPTRVDFPPARSTSAAAAN